MAHYFARSASYVVVLTMLVLRVTTTNADSDNNRTVSTSKSRFLLINLNALFPAWCNLNPYVSHASAQVPAGCAVSLIQEPSQGELFAAGISGPELHEGDRSHGNNSILAEDNVWFFAESTFTGSDNDDVAFRSGEKFAEFEVEIFSPKAAANRSATGFVSVNIINHRPQAASSTLILRLSDPWVNTGQTNKSFYFPRGVFLQASDADTNAKNPQELAEVTNITARRWDGTPITYHPVFVDISAEPLLNSDSYDPASFDDNVFIVVNTSDGQHQALSIAFNAKDEEGASSPTTGQTYIVTVPSGDGLLPEAPMTTMVDPQSYRYSVGRLYGVPSVVLCKFMQGGATFSDCNFVLHGADILATQVSMSAIVPGEFSDELDIQSMIALDAVLGDSVETEGNFRIAKYTNISVDDHYPSSPSVTPLSPLFGAKFTVSDITENSPPDVIVTDWHVHIQEFANKSVTGTSYHSLKVPLRIYSQYVTPPQLQCDDVTFQWVRRTLVVPTNCGVTSDYDVSCDRYLTEGNQLQTVAVLPGFRIAFPSNDALEDYVWTKDSDAVFLVTAVDSEAATTGGVGSPDGGCVFHSLLLRELRVGDVVHSESDLMWMPEVTGLPPYRWQGAGDYQLCSARHTQLRLKVIVGDDVACTFLVKSPSTTTPSTDPPSRRAYQLVQPFMARVLEDVTAVGSIVIPFALHDVVAAQVKDKNAKQETPEELSRAFKLVPNIASQSIMLGYANGAMVYPQQVIASRKTIFVPTDPFPSADAPQPVQAAYDKNEKPIWTVHVRRLLTALVTSTSPADVYPTRRVAFTSQDVQGSIDDDIVLVNLVRDDKQDIDVGHRSLPCSMEDEGDKDDPDVQSYYGEHPLMSTVLQNWFTSFTNRSGSQYVDKDLIAGISRKRIVEKYELAIEPGAVKTLSFKSIDNHAWLVVTRHPKLLSVVSHYDADHHAPWWTKAIPKAANGSKVPLRPTETSFTEQCAALAIQIEAADAIVQESAGEMLGYADDVLGVAVTNGLVVSAEILFLIRVGKPIHPREGVNDSFTANGNRPMDVPLLVVCALVFTSVLMYHRRKLRRFINRIREGDFDGDSSEDIDAQRRASERRSEGILKTIRSMVATKSSAAFTRLSSGRSASSRSAAATLSDDDDDHELAAISVTVSAPSAPSAAAPHLAAADGDDWDDWEAASCAPHVAVRPPTEPPQLQSSGATHVAPAATKPPVAPRKVSKKD